MVTVKEQVKEALVGTTDVPDMSQETRQSFLAHAVPDAETGELYLGKDQFINAIAPEGENYVRLQPSVKECPDATGS